MISIQASPGAHNAITRILMLERATEIALNHAWKESGRVVTGELRNILSTGPRTGRIYRVNGREHQASSPGEPPARRTGRLVDSVGYKVSGHIEMVVGEEADYAAWLENGTRKMKPRPHLTVAVRRTGTTVQDTIGRYLMEIYR